MSIRTLVLLLVAFSGVASPVWAAHPGHGSKAVVGVLKDVTRDAVVIEVLDPGAGGLTRVRVKLDPDTRFRLDKEQLPSLEPYIGHRVSAAVEWEDDDRGGQTMTATEVKVARAKKPQPQPPAPQTGNAIQTPSGSGVPTSRLRRIAG